MTDVPPPPFGRELTRLVNEILQSLREQQADAQQMASRLARIGQEAVRGLADRFPQNWLDLERGTVAPFRIMEETSWCLLWVPRAEVLGALLGAPDNAQRERVLLASKKLVVVDLLNCLDDGSRPEIADEIAAARDAVEAFADGHYRSAQAMAATALDFVILAYGGVKRATVPQKWRTDVREESIRTFRYSAMLDCVAQGMTPYDSRPGRPVPTAFNRNASAHTVSSKQFTEVNSLTALMLVAAFLKEISIQIDAGT